MAKTASSAEAQAKELISRMKSGEFSPVYLLMGDEPYYPDLVCEAVLDNALDESSRDFNETVCYGADVSAETVITAARRFPMMAPRQVVVVKDAQGMSDIEKLSLYCENPLDSTVLVLLLRGAVLDKRKSLYKQVQKKGVILESNALRDYEIASWISRYFASRSVEVSPEAAALMGEHTGTSLGKIVVETDKLLKNLPEGTAKVSVKDIERNVGVSREFSIFELTKELSLKNGPKAISIATHLGQAAKFAMPMAVAALYTHFSRILRYAALKEKDPRPERAAVAAALQGVNPYFWREYDTAVANYPVRKALAVISLLCEYDYKGKGGDAGSAQPKDLMIELVSKILNI